MRAKVKYCILVFVVTYGLYCLTKHSPIFAVLMIGRLLAGVATSILFSAFESWLVSEQNRRGFESSLISDTFSKAHFGNAIVSIVSGQVAGFVADRFGKVAPFDTLLLLFFSQLALSSCSHGVKILVTADRA